MRSQKLPCAAAHAEQLWKLRACQDERHAGLKPDQHRFGDEVDDDARAHQPTRPRPSRATSMAVQAASAANRCRVSVGECAQRRAHQQ